MRCAWAARCRQSDFAELIVDPRPVVVSHRMSSDNPTTETRDVMVREVPIELCQFIKFGGLAESGGAAKQLVAERAVLVNGAVETRKRKQLAAGDRVTVADKTIVVRIR